MSDVEEAHPNTRVVEFEKTASGACGFHLSRSKWDPYPWVTGIDQDSPAAVAGIRPGDCILEINGEDIVGKKISEIADRVKSGNQISLLLWSFEADAQCSPESLCCGPMPQNLQRLSACMSSILAVLECPVCLDTIPPPAHQCDNGHLVCLRCRARSERCPVCRIRLSRGRSLLADQVYSSIAEAFDLREESEQRRKAKIRNIFRGKHKNVPDIKVTQSHTNKFLARLTGKSSSVDNLSNGSTKSIPALAIPPGEENGSNLKTKSLSTSEINKVSPVPSRAGSLSHLNAGKMKSLQLRKEPESGPASYHGSFECLDSNFGNMHPVNDMANCYCPFDFDCPATMKVWEIIRHFQTDHDGPLVQYFQPNLRLPLDKVFTQKDHCYVINLEEANFFLRICDAVNDNVVKQSLFVWVWAAVDGETCAKLRFRLKIVDNEQVFLNVLGCVCSLEKTNGKTVIEEQNGVLLGSEILQLLRSLSGELCLAVEIVRVGEREEL